MKTKKNTRSVMAGLMLAGSLLSAAYASAAAKEQIVSESLPIEILYDARQLATDVPPENVAGSIVVPIRFISDKMGAEITLSGNKISVVKGTRILDLTIGASTAMVNGKPVKLNVPVRLTKGRTLVPLRVISEGLGLPIEWDPTTQFVWIGSKSVPKVEDIGIKRNGVDVKKYFKKVEVMLNDYNGGYRPIYEVTAADLPFALDSVTYYRFDLAKSNFRGLVRVTSNYSASSFNLMFFNADSKQTRIRSEFVNLREKLNKDNFASYFAIVDRNDKDNGIQDTKDFTIKQAEYFTLVSQSFVLFKNPWR